MTITDILDTLHWDVLDRLLHHWHWETLLTCKVVLVSMGDTSLVNPDRAATTDKMQETSWLESQVTVWTFSSFFLLLLPLLRKIAGLK